MLLTQDYITAAAFLFEQARGYPHDEYETAMIQSQGLDLADPNLIAKELVDAVKSSSCDVLIRGPVYWALGKRYDETLLEFFRSSLRFESASGTEAAWEVMIALRNLGEPIFDETRSGYGCDEEDMNRADALRYLQQINIKP